MRLSIAAFLSLFLLATQATGADQPNLIWIMADDLGYGELGCYGQKVIQTPCLDRMAAEGMRFTQFYAGATVCAPSRSVLMTGQHHGHTRVRGNAGSANPSAQALKPGDVTVAGLLKHPENRSNVSYYSSTRQMDSTQRIRAVDASPTELNPSPRLQFCRGPKNSDPTIAVLPRPQPY